MIASLLPNYFTTILVLIQRYFVPGTRVSLFDGMEWNDHAHRALYDDLYPLCLLRTFNQETARRAQTDPAWRLDPPHTCTVHNYCSMLHSKPSTFLAEACSLRTESDRAHHVGDR